MSLNIDLTGRVAIVTGSSRGLGFVFAGALAAAGTHVVLTGRNKNTLAAAEKKIKPAGGRIISVQLDVRNEESIKNMVAKTIAEFGKIDILVNNAGTNVRKPAVDVSWADWDTVMDTNLKGAFFCSKEAAPFMLKQKWGRIINIGSATNIMAYPKITAYCASRGGVLQLSKSLASEWGQDGVNVNVLAPGWFRTEQTQALWEDENWLERMKNRIPNRRIGNPEELGPAIVYLASEESAYVNGSLFVVDGAFTTGGVFDTIPLKSEK